MPEQNEGQVGNEQQQTESSAAGTTQTASQDGDFALDPTKTYVVNKRTGKTATGSQIRDMLGEIELKRKVESENSKLKEQLDEMQSNFGNLQAQLNQLQIQKEVASAFKATRPKQAEDIWGEEQEAQPEIDPDLVFNRINEVSEKVVESKLSKQNVDVSRMVAQELDKREQEKQQAEYLKQVHQATQKATINSFKAELPNIPDDDIKEIADKMDIIEAMKNESTMAFAQGDRDGGSEKWQDAIALQRDVYNRLAELREEHKRIDREKQREKQISDITMGAVQTRREDPKHGLTLHPNQAEKNIPEIIRNAKEIEAQLRRLRQP